MFSGVKNFLGILKDIKIILNFFGIASLASFYWQEQILYYITMYQVHFAIVFAVIILFYIASSNKRIDSVERLLRIEILKSQVASYYKQYKGEKITNRLTVMHLESLEKQRDELSVNSYTQAQLEEMIGNIDRENLTL
jgi:hypothetical protein